MFEIVRSPIGRSETGNLLFTCCLKNTLSIICQRETFDDPRNNGKVRRLAQLLVRSRNGELSYVSASQARDKYREACMFDSLATVGAQRRFQPLKLKFMSSILVV